MKISTPNKPVQTITNKIKRGNILFTHKLQRREGVWNSSQKSLLIDSLLRGYLINPTYTAIEDGKQYVIDGVQRLYSIASFIADGYRLSKNLDPIVIDNESYEIAGRKFSRLDEKVQDELMAAQLQVCEITDYTDKDVREMFRRLNSGKPLNASQKMTPDMSDELSDAISGLVSHPFFEKTFSPTQLKNSTDLLVVIELLMLTEKGGEQAPVSFRKADRQKFIASYNDKVNEDTVNRIRQALDRLDGAFEDSVRLKQTSVPMACYGMYRVLNENRNAERYLEWLREFIDSYDSNEEYIRFCNGAGTSSADMVKGRLDYFDNAVNQM